MEKINEKERVKINGGVNYSSIFYTASGIESRRDPFTWYMNGNININIIDFNIPLSYSYTNQRGIFAQPFNRVGLTPVYKWIKGFAGYNTMTFSPYSLSGHIFLGGGIELSPKAWRLTAMYGQLNRAIPWNTTGTGAETISYRRMGKGIKAGYEKSGHELFLSYFSAGDDPSSIPFVPPDASVLPMENTVVSASGKTVLYKLLRLECEYAVSGLTRNMLSENLNSAARKNLLPGIFNMRASSGFFTALKSSAGLQGKSWGVMLNYEKIDPGYQTLGAYYMNNDLENITVSPSLNLFKGKLTFSANAGAQRNNLEDEKQSTTRRFLGAFNAGFAPSQKWNFSFTHTGFSTYTRQRPKTDPFLYYSPDTLNFYQVTRSTGFSAMHMFGSTAVKHTLLLNGMGQSMGQQTGQYVGSGAGERAAIIPSVVYSGNSGYVLALVKQSVSVSVMANVNQSRLQGITTLYYGPSLTVGKGFLKNKIRVSAGTVYNNVLLNGNSGSTVLNHRAGFSYHPRMKNEKTGKFSISVQGSVLQKLKTGATTQPFTEFTGNVAAGYGF